MGASTPFFGADPRGCATPPFTSERWQTVRFSKDVTSSNRMAVRLASYIFLFINVSLAAKQMSTLPKRAVELIFTENSK